MISFDHVTYAYEGKETPSLRDCTFSVKPGELILLTGESGCGLIECVVHEVCVVSASDL